MPKDEDQQRRDELPDDSTGAREPINDRTTSSATGEEDDDRRDATAIEFELVTDAVTAEQRDQQIHDVVTPSQDTRVRKSFTIPSSTATTYKSIAADISVTTVVGPSNWTAGAETFTTIPTTELNHAAQSNESVTTVVTSKQEVTPVIGPQVVTARDVRTEQTTGVVTNQMTLTQQTVGGEDVRLDDDDPVFTWRGGTPYTSAHPQLIVHRNKEDVTTLPFLHALLRDTYTELRGGEPGAEAVEFVANEPRIPQIQENIVTLDLTGDAWEPALQDDQPRIERSNLDIIPHLRTVASQLYTGDLGYFVVNVPNEWEDSMLRPQFFQQLVAHLADTTVTDLDDETSDSWVDQLNEAPVLLADPRVDDSDTLRELVQRYYSVPENLDAASDDASPDSAKTQGTTVPQIEAMRERALRQNDANRILLTEQQSNGGESDEHYLWKAAIVEGLARQMYNNKYNSESNPNFTEFLDTHLLTTDIIKTEDDDGENDTQPDVVVNPSDSQEWVNAALDRFLPNNSNELHETVIEFETGRSEGAFNFRKFRESIEKYVGTDRRSICVVVPTRLLFRGETRARMILRIVKTTGGNDEFPSVSVAVPTLARGTCQGLQSARSVVKALYRGADDDT